MNKDTPSAQVCCSTPASMLFWGIVFVATFVALMLVSVYYWRPLSTAALAFAIGVGCVANWLKNRTYHCGITGPIFLLGSGLFLMTALAIVHVNSAIVWGLLIAGTVIAFALEARYAAG